MKPIGIHFKLALKATAGEAGSERLIEKRR
jgi:hypothetical protein